MSPQMDISGNKLGRRWNQSEEANLHAIHVDYDKRFWLPIALLWDIDMMCSSLWMDNLGLLFASITGL